MNVKKISMIVAVAVALTIAVAGVVSASPEVEPPIETSIITTVVDIECYGSVTEVENFKETHSTVNLTNKTLETDERVGQIQYQEDLNAQDGFVQFQKDFKFDGDPANPPNLAVEKRIGFMDDPTSLVSWLDSTENVGMSIVTQGDTDGPGGMEGLCPWAQDVCIPAGNEMIAAGSQLSRVALVSAQTKTSATTTDSPRLHHEIDARGTDLWGMWGDEAHTEGPYGKGTVSAGMKVSTWEGHDCDTTYPLAQTVTYDEMTSASGLWKFSKTMTYVAQIRDVQMPRTFPVFNLPA
ncbi:hypothetical protein C5S31_11075 [ANME-1 cluster archaeon GoMg2]|nr:hypothetical protein [ANME-1 cluster archaeon GoMg2]